VVSVISGDQIILASAYNVSNELEEIVEVFVKRVEEILREFGVHKSHKIRHLTSCSVL
jgi:hypothetical protein